MKKKAIETFHPLAMAKSLSAQNEAVGLLLMKIKTWARVSEERGYETMKTALSEIAEEAERCRAVIWPDETE